MSIAGHVSRAVLSRYSHVRREAKRRALDGIATRQREADERRKKDAERSSLTNPHSGWAALFIRFLQTDLGDPEGFEPSWGALEEHCLIR